MAFVPGLTVDECGSGPINLNPWFLPYISIKILFKSLNALTCHVTFVNGSPSFISLPIPKPYKSLLV